MPLTLCHAKLLTPTETIDTGAITVSDDGKILYVGSAQGAPQTEGPWLDMDGRAVVPGFIDIHAHGGAGIAFGVFGSIAEDLAAYSRWVASVGVTGFLCSVAAADPRALVQVIGAYADALDAAVPGAEALGLHLEGPFLNKEKTGALNPAWIRQASMDEAEEVLRAGRGWIRQVTLAPEVPGADEVAARFHAAGVVVALGHSNADYALARSAFDGHFTHVTHTFNAQRGFHHREPGVLGAAMASNSVTAEVIADGVHVHPAAIQILIRCLGPERVVLVSDAMVGAGMPDGQYEWMGRSATVTDGQARLPDGTLAGSTATLNQCVRNVHRQVGVSLPDAVRMATLNPARAMGLARRLGTIEVGKDASLAVIDEEVNVYLCMVRGRVVYQKPKLD